MKLLAKLFLNLFFIRKFSVSILLICLILSFTACGSDSDGGGGDCNHDWSAWIETKAPTCTEAGVETRTCSLNGAHKETRSGAAALGHDWNMTTGTAPTCSAPGNGTGSCNRCGETVTGGAIPIDPNLHNWGAWGVTTAATCTGEGVETRTCALNGAHKETRSIDALGHDWNITTGTAPTCSAPGSGTGSCNICGETVAGAEIPIDPNLHNWGSVVTAPTCETAGYTTQTCSYCSVTRQINPTDATGHTWGSVVTAPTCETAGYTMQTCTVCSATRQINPTDALGHDQNSDICTKCFKIQMQMAEIQAGSFTMGPDFWNNNATFQVTFNSGFYMSKYLVTQELYKYVMGTNPSYFDGSTTGKGPDGTEVQGKRPVEQVNWYHAIAFCNRLSILEGRTAVYSITGIDNTDADAWLHSKVPIVYNAAWDAVTADWTKTGYRLPTDAQWEYACRAGTSTKWHFGDDESKLEEYAWYGWDDTLTIRKNSNDKTHQVGLLEPNQNGLYDMHGNVFEWCWDRYDDYPTGPETDWVGPPAAGVYGAYRVLRGGSWYDSAENLRSVSRKRGNPGLRSGTVGFRVVRPQFCG